MTSEPTSYTVELLADLWLSPTLKLDRSSTINFPLSERMRAMRQADFLKQWLRENMTGTYRTSQPDFASMTVTLDDFDDAALFRLRWL